MPNEVEPNRKLSEAQLRAGIARLSKRLEELDSFDPEQAHSFSNSEAKALSTAIEDSLDAIFGENTRLRRRYSDASDLCKASVIFFEETPVHEIIQGYRDGKASSKRMLERAVEYLQEELSYIDGPIDMGHVESGEFSTKKVFVVHGHDDLAKQEVARFLEAAGLDAIILHERASKGMTIIEKLEQYSDVGFAIVLLTPDDMGAHRDNDEHLPRARQNVILELGYFLGRLGRDRVCALKKSTVEVPSDFDGVVYNDMDARGAWKLELARELKAAEMKFNPAALL